MLKNYLKIAYRTLLRNKSYSFINIFGLALGIASCLVIMLYVVDELRFDMFHSKADRIYRVMEEQDLKDRGLIKVGVTARPVAMGMVEEFPEVATKTSFLDRMTLGRFPLQYGDKLFHEGDYIIAEPSFFDVFDFGVVSGNPESFLTEPKSVVLTEATANKLFGNENPMGKTIELGRDWLGDCRVTGVIKNPPKNSHLQFSMLISFATVQQIEDAASALTSWDWDQFSTYIVLNENASIESVREKIPAFTKTHQAETFGVTRKLILQPLSDVHFGSAEVEFERNYDKSDITYIYVFSAIALFIIIIASINYMNLTTARSLNRAREVGLRKVVGAERSQLITQFLYEAFVITFAALLIAALLVEIILPSFNAFTGKELGLKIGSNYMLILAVVAGTFLVGLISGIGPAFVLSRFKAVTALKGEVRSSTGRSYLREGMVVFQFTLSIVMIFATVVVFNQMNYISNTNLGFIKDRIVTIDINSRAARTNFEAMRTEFGRHPNVESVTVTTRVPGEWKHLHEVSTNRYGLGEDDLFSANFIGADHNFINTFGMEILEGRNFTENPADSNSVILNEAAVQAYGFDDPLGKQIVIPNAEYTATVVGVVKDFHFRSLHEKIGPLVLGYWYNPVTAIDYYAARLGGGSVKETLEHFADVHASFDQSTPVEINFLDERINEFYKKDRTISMLINIAALLAVIIACMGLYGLSLFTAQKRTKEISIRKVLGASVPGLVVTFTKDFLKLVAIAAVIALPAAYYAVQLWLNDFAYRTDIGFGTFAISIAAAIVIAFGTISFQAVKVSYTNPAKSLKYE